jgi:hypothetical protein
VYDVSVQVSGGRRERLSERVVLGEPLRRLALVALGLLAFASALVLIAVARGQQLSPVDEPAHADYAYAISHGAIPGKGSPIGDEIRYEWSCHGLGDTVKGRCDTVGGTYAAGAQDYTFGDPPLYYLTTGLIARGLDALIPGGHQFITLGRCVGILWLASAMLVLYLALRRFRVGWQYAAAAAALLPLCPGVLAASSTITSDAPAALSGAAALFVLARLTVERRTGWLLPAAVAALATGTKVLNAMPMLTVACVAFFLAVAAYRRGDKSEARRTAGVCAAIAAAFGLVYLGWSAFQSGRGQAGWVNPNKDNGIPLKGSAAGDLLSNVFGTYQHLATNYWLPAQINGETVVIWATLLGVLLGAAPLLVMAVSRTRSWGWTLGLAAFASVSLVPLVVEFQVYQDNGEYFASVAARYAMSFLPWMIACLAVVAGRRRLARTGFAFVGIGAAVLLLAETGLFTLGPALVSRVPFLVG